VKAIKMIGLAALAALAAMAIVGATSASATRLCNADEASCTNPTTSVHATSVGKAKLLTSLGTTECNVLFSSTEVGAEATVQILEGNFTYTNCTLGGSSCTATEENGPAEIKVEKTGYETAKVTGEGLVRLVCSGFIDCSFNGIGLESIGKGSLFSTEANGEASEGSGGLVSKEAGGFLCPKTANLNIKMTPLSATYISG